MYRLFCCLSLFMLAALAYAPSTAQDETAEPKPVDYLIVCADGLGDAAKEWADWRTQYGRVVRLLKLRDIKNEAAPSLEEIKEAIRKEAGGEKPRNGFQVLLLGDCPVEKSEGYDAGTEIPWQLTPQLDSSPVKSRRARVPTDNYYADLVEDLDHKPDIAVGRVPACTPEQARLALKKVMAYETAPVGEWMRNLTFFAGEGRFGELVDTMLENLFMQFAEKSISQDYNLRMTYANIRSSYAYAPSRFSHKVIEEANAGALVLAYMGHGSWDRLDDMYVKVGDKVQRYPILTGNDVKDFAIPDGKLPVMLIIACDTGYMDHKGECLAERIVFTEKAPVAVLASSRNSHPYANALLQKAFLAEITERKRATLGEAMLLAKRELVEAKDPDRVALDLMAMMILPDKSERDELNRSHISMYNLTGDPGLRLRHPNVKLAVNPPHEVGPFGLTPGSKFSMWMKAKAVLIEDDEVPTIPNWRAECTARRTAIVGQLRPVATSDLVDASAEKRKSAEDLLAANHAVSNSKTLPGVTAEISLLGTDARHQRQSFELQWVIGEDVVPGNYILKVLVVTKKGDACAFTSHEITVKEAPQKDAPEGENPGDE